MNEKPKCIKTPIIFSASRRSDLVGWYPEMLAEMISRKIARFRSRFLYGIVFWTRFPKNLLEGPLRELLNSRLDNVVVNLTLTGLGGSRLEPLAPNTDQILEALPGLIELLGGPVRLRWRFDPLLYKISSIETFDHIAENMAKLGVNNCTFSFPAERSLRGALENQYKSEGLSRWPDLHTRKSFLDKLVETARKHKIKLLSCSQPDNIGPEIEPAQCIPLEILKDLHPLGLDYPSGKDTSQRKHCRCPVSEDLGDYKTHLCRTGCVYCYSPAGGPCRTGSDRAIRETPIGKLM